MKLRAISEEELVMVFISYLQERAAIRMTVKMESCALKLLRAPAHVA